MNQLSKYRVLLLCFVASARPLTEPSVNRQRALQEAADAASRGMELLFQMKKSHEADAQMLGGVWHEE